MNADGEIRLGVDVGGTFTDLAALVDGRVVTAKVPTTPSDQAEGVMRVVEAAPVETARVRAFAHGMTVATNALLERHGAATALVTTEGFRDVLEIGRQNRPHLYDLTQDRPSPLVPRGLRFTVRERTGPRGVVEPLDENSVRTVIEALDRTQVEAVAVCLLFAFLHPEHEQEVGRALREALPHLQVSLSSEVLPEFREYERFSTTAADAYLAPKLASYLRSLARRAGQASLPAPRVMQSSGGVADIASAAGAAATCVLSGPAGGVVGAAFAAGQSGYRDLLTFDMGGTSTDVAPIVDGEVQTTTDAVVAGVPLKHPMVDVHTVSAGGGSIAYADAGGALHVGPRSAGAEPGPACYGRGGELATVTDANLYLGYLGDGVELGGEVRIRRDLAERALVAVGSALGLDALETALGVVRVENAEMTRALRVISIERGLDPRDFALVAFGGAGGMHACALAEDLDIGTVLVPRACGVLSAVGLAISDTRRDYVRSLLADLAATSAEDLSLAFGELERRARDELGPSTTLTRQADLRYQRQSFELTVPGDDYDGLRERFHRIHERRHGYAMPEDPIEIVNVRLVANVPVEKPALRERPPQADACIGVRRANFGGHWVEASVYDRNSMGAGSRVQGPAIVEFAEATCVAPAGWTAVVDDAGTLVLERGCPPKR